MEPPSPHQVPPKTRIVSLGELTREFPPGTKVDRYEIVGSLGSGGCGVVYAAKHVHLDQTVALKLLHRNLIHSEERVQRFFREARAAAAVGNPHIVRVSDCGVSEEGIPFLAMEFLKGVVLEELLDDQQPLPLERALPIELQILDGLQAAHEAGVVHRDLKPENIFLIAAPDGGDFVKIVDFGVSKVFKDTLEYEKQLTGTGALLGTPRYMAPEQFRGARNVDHRADLFAAAVVLYQMLSGKLPFDGRSPLELAHKASTEPPRPLEELAPQVPPSIRDIVYRGLEKDPDRRWPDARAFAKALRDAFEKIMVEEESSGVSRAFKTLAGVVSQEDLERLNTTLPQASAKLQTEDDGPTFQTSVASPAGASPAPGGDTEDDEGDPTVRSAEADKAVRHGLVPGDEAEGTLPWGGDLRRFSEDERPSPPPGGGELSGGAPAEALAAELREISSPRVEGDSAPSVPVVAIAPPSEPSMPVVAIAPPSEPSMPVVAIAPPPVEISEPVEPPRSAPSWPAPEAAPEPSAPGLEPSVPGLEPSAPGLEPSAPVAEPRPAAARSRNLWRVLIVLLGLFSLVGGLLLGLALVTPGWLEGGDDAGPSSNPAASASVELGAVELAGSLDRAAFEAVLDRARPHFEMCRAPGQDLRVLLEAHVTPPGFASSRLSMVRPAAASTAPEATTRCCVEAFRAGVPSDWNPGESGIATFEVTLPGR